MPGLTEQLKMSSKFKDLSCGDRISVQLVSKEVFEGSIVMICPTYIQLEEVYCVTTDSTWPELINVFAGEIVELNRLIAATCNSTGVLSYKPEKSNAPGPMEGAVVQLGDNVLITLHTGDQYLGEVELLDNRCVDLRGVMERFSGADMGSRSFYRHEVSQIEIVKAAVNGCSHSDEKDNSDTNIEVYEKLKALRLTARDPVYIDSRSGTYERAVERLRDSHCIAVLGLGSLLDANNDMTVLLMCNHKVVYVFDLLLLQYKCHELIDILGDSDITKVTYDSRNLAIYAWRRYRRRIENLLDLQILDEHCQKLRTNEKVVTHSNYSQCFSYHLNTASYTFSAAMDELADCHWTMKARPFQDTTGKLSRMAQLVASYLILKDHFMRLLLKDVDHLTEQRIYETIIL